MSDLSQATCKVTKLVLAAAFWTVPHLVVLDEPTNFLDREALGALSIGLKEWGGAVIMISHNRYVYYDSLCLARTLVCRMADHQK